MQVEVNKAQQALNETVIVSGVSGIVVKVNNDTDPSSKSSQTLVHVVTGGQLQVKGTLTEYDLTNIKTGQNVRIKSKVYLDQEQTGTTSYVSNCPNQSNDSSGTGGSSPFSGSTFYDYKVGLTGDISDLQQGFTVSIEVVNENENRLAPIDAVANEDDKNYVWVYDKDSQRASKIEVTFGGVDTKQQGILSGLGVGQIVIPNPDSSLEDGEKVPNATSDDTATAEESEVSEQ